MELNIEQRLALLQVLPKEGDILTIRIMHQLRNDLSFSEEELASLQLKSEGQVVTWNRQGEIPKDIEIGDKAFSIIKESLEVLNAQKKLMDGHLSLWDIFCVQGGQNDNL